MNLSLVKDSPVSCSGVSNCIPDSCSDDADNVCLLLNNQVFTWESEHLKQDK